MKNRIASLFLVFALLMSLCNVAVARDNRIIVQSGGAERFTDVPTSHWAYSYINKVVGSGLFNGKTPTTFDPSSAMTRSQFVMVMARMEGRSDLEGVVTQTIFPDVATTRRAAGPIAWATEEGFVNGFGDGTFKPDSPITRGQFAALIHRYIIAKRYVNLHVVDPEPAQFTDAASVSTAFTQDVEYARIHGLLTGYSDGTVRASNPITRAAIAAILARFLDLVTESGYTPLLDGPIIGGDDNGDSGDTGDTTPVEVPTVYDDVKLKVNGDTHGTTSLVVTRDDEIVASDDVQEGDRVTVTHIPDSGYGVRVTVKNSKGKSITKHTSGNTTWFVVPAEKYLPVTVTVSYDRSGGSSGGGGGGSSSGGGYTPTTYYYLLAQATVAPTEADNATHGTVFLSNAAPTAETTPPVGLTTQRSAQIPGLTPNITAYAIFIADNGYELDTDKIQTTPETGVTVNKNFEPVTLNSGVKVYFFSFTATGTVNSSTDRAMDVVVSAPFKATGGGEQPPAPETFTWTVTPEVIGGFVAVSETDNFNEVLTANVGLTVNDGKSAQFTQLTSDTPKTVYVAVSPAPLYMPTALSLSKTDQGKGAETEIRLSEGNDKLHNSTLYVYELTITGITSDVTTTLTGAYNRSEALKYAVDVTARYLDADGNETAAPTDALAPDKDKAFADKDETVTVTVPVADGFTVESVKVTGNGFDDFDATLDQETKDSTTQKYTFAMPEGDVTVVVTFKAIPPEQPIAYKVNVTFEGEGSIALNIGGKEYMFSSDDEATTDPTFTVLPSEYQANYPNGIPAYLVSTIPATSKGYKLASSNDRITPASIRTSTKDACDYTLTDTVTELNVTVKFVKEYSFGYNLTIIGDGSATVKLGDSEKTYSANGSDSILSESNSVELIVKNVTAGPTSKPITASFTASVDGQSLAQNTGYAMQPGTVAEVVVAFLPADAQPTLFTVELVGSGTVDISAENAFMAGNSIPSNAEEALNASTTKTAQVSTTSKTFTGYAYSGTVITLKPNTDEDSVVKSIVVDGNEQIRDELPSDGFSYALLQDQSNKMVVTLAEFAGYDVLMQAPYKGQLSNGDTGLHTNSQVDKDAAKTVTLRQVLDSLNNGTATYFNGSNFTTINNIKNHIGSTFGMAPKIAQLYLYNPSTGEKTASATTLETKLNDGVKSNIGSNIGQMISGQKKAMIDNAETPIKNLIKDRLADVQVTVPADLAETVKPEIVQQVLNSDATPDTVKRAYAAGQITDSNFTVDLTTTVLKLESDETSANITDRTRATGKSLEAQLTRKLVKEYLRDPAHVDILGADTMGLEPKVELEMNNAVLTSSGVLTIPVSASATVANEPTLKQEPSFAAFMTTDSGSLDLDAWVVVKATISVTLPGATAPQSLATQEIFKQVEIPAAQVTSIKNMLSVVNNTLTSKWDETWGSLTSTNGAGQTVLTIALNEVITEDMLETIINGDDQNEGLLTQAKNRIVKAISSLGEANATKSKFMNLYTELVNFEADENGHLSKLQLKTKGGEYNDLLTVNGNKLNLNVDLNTFFKDVNGTDQTSFELLLDLLFSMRDGIATDIRTETAQNPQAVFAKMLERQLSSKKVTVVKWGAPIDLRQNDAAKERKEVAGLLAELIMQEETVKLHDAWKNFEAKGYSSISMEIGMPNNADMRNALENSGYGFNSQSSIVGFKMERKLADS